MMTCSGCRTKLLGLADGGPADAGTVLAEEHLRGCGRCAAFLCTLQRAESVLRTVPAESPELPVEEARALVRAAISEARRTVAAPERVRYRVRFALASAALLLAAGALAVFLGDRREKPLTAAAAPAAGIATFANDTVVSVNDQCRVVIRAHSVLGVDRISPRVFVSHLETGSVLLKARRHSYDTLAVRCGSLTAYATGTFFGVRRDSDGVRVSVVQGSVRVVSDSGRSDTVGALSEMFFYGTDRVWYRDTLLPDSLLAFVHHMLFACGSACDAAADSEFTAIVAPARHYSGTRRIELPLNTLYGADSNHYAIVKAMMSKGNYRSAAYVIRDYLLHYRTNDPLAYSDLGICFYRAGEIDSALAAFGQALRLSSNDRDRSTAQHRINKLLYKRGKYREALDGIRAYLAQYPRGEWRDREYYYGINAEIALREYVTGSELAAQAQREFPKSCQMHRLVQELVLDAQ